MPVAVGSLQIVQVAAGELLAVDGQAGAVEALEGMDASDQPFQAGAMAAHQQVVGLQILPLAALVAFKDIQKRGGHDAEGLDIVDTDQRFHVPPQTTHGPVVVAAGGIAVHHKQQGQGS